MHFRCFLPVLLGADAAPLEDDVSQLQLRPKVADEVDDIVADPLSEHGSEALRSLLQEKWESHPQGHPLAHFAAVNLPKPYVPQPDFSDSVMMDREFVDDYPQKFTASIPMAQNGITIIPECNAIFGLPPPPLLPALPCVDFPMDTNMANIVGRRSTVHSGSEEIGELRWMGDVSPAESAVPGSVFGFAERFHVLQHPTGAWADTESKPAGFVEEAGALEATPNRTAKVLQFQLASKLGNLQNSAIQDLMWKMDLEKELKSNSKAADEVSELTEISGITQQMQTLKASVGAVPSGTQPLSIPTACVHFLEHPLVKTDRTTRKVYVAMGMNLPLFRGQTIFSPSYQWSASAGKAFLVPVGDDLIFHMSSSLYASFDIERTNMGTTSASSTYRETPVLRLSGPNGGLPSDEVQAIDLRGMVPAQQLFAVQRQDTTHMTTMNTLFKSYAVMPRSYKWLYQNIDDVCSPSHLATNQAELAHADISAMVAAGNTPEAMGHMAHLTTDLLPCGLGFLRGSEDESNYVDDLEVFVWIHFLMEWTPDKRWEAIRGSSGIANGWHWKHMPATTAAPATAAEATTAE